MKRLHDEMMGEDRHGEKDDELGDDDDEVGRIPPYDAKKEARPPCKIYDPEFKIIQDKLQQCIERLETPFRETSFSNGSTKGLLDELQRRVKDKSAEKVKIGVVGDMKSGKSSVINSVLSVGVIARQGDAGSSCTWVVNEFGYLLPNQSKTFAAEVYFFSQKERREIMKSLLADYYRASGKDHEKSDGEKDAEQSVDDFATTQTVVTALRALFIEFPGFSTPAQIHAYLSEATSEDDGTILNELYTLSDQVIAQCLKGHTSVRVEAALPQSLLLQLAPYQYTVQERGLPSPSLWPFVNHIQFGLDCELLKSVTLVDLPGLSDANKTRAATSTAHLRTCTHYMIVAEIGRATDDKFIREHLTKGFMTRGSGHTFRVLTHADTIDDATEIEMTRKGQQQLDACETKITELEQRKKDLNMRMRKTAKGMQYYQFMEDRDKTIVEMREMIAKHKELRIHNRSRNIVRLMQQMYADLTSDPIPLGVFCVGNAAYKKHQAGYGVDDPNPPTLSVKGTSIPDLRQHLLLAPAEGRLNETHNQSLIQLPVVKQSFALYAAKQHMARKEEIERIVLDPQRLVAGAIDVIFEELKAQFEVAVLEPFRADEFEWTSEAHDLCKSWQNSYATAKHLAMLKNDGVQKGRTKGNNVTSWNADLLHINSDEIRAWAKAFLPSIPAATKNLHDNVTTLVSRMITAVSIDEQVALMALKPFLDYIVSEKRTIATLVEPVGKSLRKEFGNILRATLNEDVNGPLARSMAPVYAKAREIKGKRGGPKIRLEVFAKMVTKQGSGVYMETHDLLKKDIHDMLDRHAQGLKKTVLAFFENIARTFNMMCADDGGESEEEARLRTKAQKNLVLVDQILDEELLPLAEKFFRRQD